MQEKEIPSVKTSAVARAVKEIGQFMLMDMDEGCFLVTERFILQLKRRDAWRIQCKLEVERRNIYYNKIKSNWVPSDKKPDHRRILEKLYFHRWSVHGRNSGSFNSYRVGHCALQRNAHGWPSICWRV